MHRPRVEIVKPPSGSQLSSRMCVIDAGSCASAVHSPLPSPRTRTPLGDRYHIAAAQAGRVRALIRTLRAAAPARTISPQHVVGPAFHTCATMPSVAGSAPPSQPLFVMRIACTHANV